MFDVVMVGVDVYGVDEVGVDVLVLMWGGVYLFGVEVDGVDEVGVDEVGADLGGVEVVLVIWVWTVLTELMWMVLTCTFVLKSNGIEVEGADLCTCSMLMWTDYCYCMYLV